MNFADFLLGFASGGTFVALAFWSEWHEITNKKRRARAWRRRRRVTTLDDRLLANMLRRGGA